MVRSALTGAPTPGTSSLSLPGPPKEPMTGGSTPPDVSDHSMVKTTSLPGGTSIRTPAGICADKKTSKVESINEGMTKPCSPLTHAPPTKHALLTVTGTAPSNESGSSD